MRNLRNRSELPVSAARRTRRQTLGRRGAIALPFALILLCCTCTPEQRYRRLSFFFDGVPRPGEAQKVVARGNGKPADSTKERAEKVTPKKKLFTHEPFAKRKCEDCHGDPNAGVMLAVDSRTLCRKCHEDFGKEWSHWHGPAAVWACSQCHASHRSEYAGLLHRPGSKLCAACHDITAAEFKASDEAHAAEGDCLRCHDPHGGTDRYLLKD